MPDRPSGAILAAVAPMVETAVTPPRNGFLRLGQWLGIVLTGTLLWLLVLAAAFGIPLSGAVLAGSAAIPELARSLYVVGLYLILMGAAWWVWRLDGLRVTAAFSASRWLEGWGAGLVGLGLLTGVEISLGLAKPALGATVDPVGLLTAALVATAFGLSEEVLFRGFILGLMRRSLSPLAAIWLSGIVFAALHFLRPVDPRDVGVPFVALSSAGALLGACRLRTGSLWLGIGLHSAWVFFITANGQQGLLSFPEGGRLWSGGGSPAGGLLGVAGVGLTYLWLRWRFRGDRKA